MNPRTVIALTGRRKSGKDTFATITEARFPGLVHSLAVADWFKEFLAGVFEVPLDKFYDQNLKELPFDEPFLVDRFVADIADELERLQPRISSKEHRKNLKPFKGTLLQTPRALMEWFGHDFVSAMYGEAFHCEELGSRVEDVEAPIVIVTDARVYDQSQYLVQNFDAVPVHITRNVGVEKSNTGIEMATEEFPENWFKHLIVNPYPNLHLYERRVNDVLDKIFVRKL